MGAWAWVLAMAWLLAACVPAQSEEAAVREQLAALEQALQDRDAGDLEALLAEDFSGPGGMDKARARAMALLLMARHADLDVTWTLDEIDIQGDRARVRLSVVLLGQSTLRHFSGRGRLMDVELGLRRDDGDWMVVAARWTDKFSE